MVEGVGRLEGGGGEHERGGRGKAVTRSRIYDPESKLDVDMARMGFYRCPHIGIYCPGPPGKKTVDCLGKEECWKPEYFPWLAGYFDETPERSIMGGESLT